MYAITPGYLQAMHTRLIAGRDLDQRDKQDAPLVALVNETFVRRAPAGEDPIGKRFRHGTTGKWIQIAGVVEDGKYGSLGESPKLAIFEPMAQRWTQAQTLIARSPMPETETVRLMRRAVSELDPSLTVFNDGSLTSALGLALFPAKLVAVVLGIVRSIGGGSGGNGRLRNHGLRGIQENAGDRHPHGSGRCSIAGGARGADADGEAAGSGDNDWLRDGVRGRKTSSARSSTASARTIL